MNGYKFEIETPKGQIIPHYDLSENIEYTTESNTAVYNVKTALDYLFEQVSVSPDIDLSQIHIQDGYWYVGDTNTGQKAQGPQGEPGTPVYVGTGGGSAVINKGTFNEAYQYATTPQEVDGETVDLSNTVFQWLLIETDDNNNTITKMIYHTGNGNFVDALGGRVIGKINGFNIS